MIPVISIAALLSIAGISPVHAGKHSSWQELEALFGKRIDSREVQAFVTRNDLSSSGKFGWGWFYPKDNAYYIRYKSFAGWSRVWSIRLRVANPDTEGWRAFSSELPLGLKAADSKSDIELKLGKSKPVDAKDYIPRGMDRCNWIAQGLELKIDFDKKSGKISEIHVSKAVNDQSKNKGKAERGGGGLLPTPGFGG